MTGSIINTSDDRTMRDDAEIWRGRQAQLFIADDDAQWHKVIAPGDIMTFDGEAKERRWMVVDNHIFRYTAPHRPKRSHYSDMRRAADEAKQRRRAGNRAARAARKRNRK